MSLKFPKNKFNILCNIAFFIWYIVTPLEFEVNEAILKQIKVVE